MAMYAGVTILPARLEDRLNVASKIGFVRLGEARVCPGLAARPVLGHRGVRDPARSTPLPARAGAAERLSTTAAPARQDRPCALTPGNFIFAHHQRRLLGQPAAISASFESTSGSSGAPPAGRYSRPKGKTICSISLPMRLYTGGTLLSWSALGIVHIAAAQMKFREAGQQHLALQVRAVF